MLEANGGGVRGRRGGRVQLVEGYGHGALDQDHGLEGWEDQLGPGRPGVWAALVHALVFGPVWSVFVGAGGFWAMGEADRQMVGASGLVIQGQI
ncbi:hypothetical protein LIER_34718 [Lithospermum erythrorhizon]|uniref:Uncharacterized protein n=1 Tax=Lithospermum erythrorhizon TaxID=34254 RepID=A0AAV3S386_LITER